MDKPLHELLNLYRIFPRLTLAFMLWMTLYSFNWFIDLDKPSAEQASVVIAVTGATITFSKFYIQHKPGDNLTE